MDGDSWLRTDKFTKLARFMIAGCSLFFVKEVLLGNGKDEQNIQVKVTQNLMKVDMMQNPKLTPTPTPAPAAIPTFKFQPCPLDIEKFPDLLNVTPKYKTRNLKSL